MQNIGASAVIHLIMIPSGRITAPRHEGVCCAAESASTVIALPICGFPSPALQNYVGWQLVDDNRLPQRP